MLWIKGGPTSAESVPLCCSITSCTLFLISDYDFDHDRGQLLDVCSFVAVRRHAFQLYYCIGVGGCLVIVLCPNLKLS